MIVDEPVVIRYGSTGLDSFLPAATIEHRADCDAPAATVNATLTATDYFPLG